MTETSTPRSTALVLRPYRGPEDFIAIAAAGDGARSAEGLLELHTPDDIRVHYEHMPNCDLHRDVVLAFADGRPAGYARTDWRDELAGERVHRCGVFVDPSVAEPVGASLALLAWAEERWAEVAGATPTARPRIRCLYPRGAGDGLAPHLGSAGYRPVRHEFLMRRRSLEDVPEVPLPAGLRLRPALTEQLRAIFEADREAFVDHWAASEEDASEEAFRQFTDDPTNDLTLWRIAWDGDVIAGQVRGYIDPAENEAAGRRLGWCENISTRRPWRGRGVARALMASTLREFRARGMTEAALTVDAQNPSGAVRLYESMGFAVAAHVAEWRRPFESADMAIVLERAPD